MTDKILAAARAAHTKALGKPQAFSLTGDGEHVDSVLCGIERPDDLADALTTARYRDWRAGDQQGELLARFQDGAAPEFALTAEAPANGSGQSGQSSARRLAEARAIIAGLVEEFEDLFPAELADAKAFLAG
jgi:hypothetical protein